jgi:hypothetical protein
MDCPDNPIIRQTELTGDYREPIYHGTTWWREDDEYANRPYESGFETARRQSTAR